jgi:[histone H3]-lysine36 N-dimethyltransferase SETMAR
MRNGYFMTTKAVRHWRLKGSREETKIKKAKRSLHCKKTMLLVFWDKYGIVHHEFLPKNRTINKEFYCQVLDRVDASIKLNRTFLKRVVFLQDNARPHTAKLTKSKLQELGWQVLPHPPYSPDLSPSDFYLFLCMANTLNNAQLKFKDECEAKNFATKFFEEKNSAFFEKGIMKLPSLWEKCVAANGDYF